MSSTLFKKLLLTLIIIITFTNCNSTIYKIDDIINTPHGTDFTKLSNKLAIDVCLTLNSYDNKEIYIPDYVNISTLNNRSQLGFILASNLKVAILSNCDKSLNIKELSVAKNIKIGKHGSKLLSRDVKNLKLQTISTNSKAIVGTYAITSKKLIIYIKVINLKNNTLVYSQTTSTNISKEVLELEGIKDNSNNPSNIYTPLVL